MWFEKTVLRVVSEEFGEESDCYEFVRPTLFFGDFMRYKSAKLWLTDVTEVTNGLKDK